MPDNAPEEKFHDLFALDMQGVLVTEINTYFARLKPVPLSGGNLAILRDYEQDPDHARKGLYALHHLEEVAYVGKTDGSLAERLSDHLKKIGARKNIATADVTFRCLYLDRNWSALAHETGLINEFKTAGGCSWNNGGFGLHDPGRNRDMTVLKENHFDRRFPVDPDIIPGIAPGSYSLIHVLQKLKIASPYLFRYETQKGFEFPGSHPDYVDHEVEIQPGETARSILGKVVAELGEEWQVTFLYGYAIMYRENRDYGASRCQCWKIGSGDWQFV